MNLSNKTKRVEDCIKYLDDVVEICERNNFLQVALPEKIIREYGLVMKNSIESAKSQSATSELAKEADVAYQNLVEGKVVKPLDLNNIRKVIKSVQDFYNNNYII